MIVQRTDLPGTNCSECKYAYEKHCRTGLYILPCGSCEHRVKRKNILGSGCLCLQKPTANEQLKGKCYYYKEYKEDEK